MEEREFDEIGSIKYTGRLVEEGVIDASAAGEALIGLNRAIRYFNEQQSPVMFDLDYEVPIKTRNGSWEAVVLALMGVGGAFALGYAKKAGEKLAENDFKDIGLGDILKKSMLAIVEYVKLIKHLRRGLKREDGRLAGGNGGQVVKVVNSQGEVFEISYEHYLWFLNAPPHLLASLTRAVTKDRILKISARDLSHSSHVSIRPGDRVLFEERSVDDGGEDFLFPEFIDGQQVALEGYLTRANAETNTVGLNYKGHIINCLPEVGSVTKYKPALFLRCIVLGRITRHSKGQVIPERRPTLIIRGIKFNGLDGSSRNRRLFE